MPYAVRPVAHFVVFASSLALAASCAPGKSASTDIGGGGSGASGPATTSQTGSGNTGQTGSTGTFGTSAASTGAGCAVHCSPDLHDVLDCNNAVVTTCPGDMACGPGGTCVAPCVGAASNASTIGCEFYATVPAPEDETTGSCFAALIANTWTTPISITADYNGTPLNVAGMARTPSGSGASLTYQPLANGMLDPGKIAILFLAQGAGAGGGHFLGCPAGVTVGANVNAAIATSGLGHAFHFTTSAPVVAYDMYPYGGAKSYVSSATLLVPTPAWGTNYIAADAFQEDPALASDGGKPFVQVVAAEDGTTVTVLPKVAIVGGPGVAAAAANTPQTYMLNHGQVLQFLQDSELAGSPISSDKPTSVWGGTGCMNIPIGTYACDSAHQELLPVKSLGHEYAAVRYRDRIAGANESVPWTLVGAVNGTTLTYDPAPPTGAPSTLSQGQLVRFDSSTPFVVKSQDAKHPFYVSGHMTGWEAISGNSGGMGDAEYVTVIPPQQFLSHYLFLTDPTYGNTNLVFVRGKASDGSFKDVTLDCGGTITGWQPIGDGDYEYTRVDLAVNGAAAGMCNNGAHTADSTAPFGLTVWGWDFAVSYAYPAGMSTQPINTVVVPPVPM